MDKIHPIIQRLRSIYQLRTEYGKQTLKEISKELTKEFGKGFDGLR